MATERLTYMQRLFVHFYLNEAKGNATDAARRAGYSRPNEAGPRLAVKGSIRAAIDAELSGAGLTASEVLARLSDIASGSLGDFLEITPEGSIAIDFAKAKRRGRLHLLKKFRRSKDRVEFELHSPLEALEKLARFHRLLDGRAGENDGAVNEFIDTIRAIGQAGRAQADG